MGRKYSRIKTETARKAAGHSFLAFELTEIEQLLRRVAISYACCQRGEEAAEYERRADEVLSEFRRIIRRRPNPPSFLLPASVTP